MGCVWSGVNIFDIIALYVFVTAVTFLVALVYNELSEFNEIFGAMYFIITLVVCVTYPIFYHPHASSLEEISEILEVLGAKLGVASYSYARGIGLLIQLKNGVIVLVSLPPFTQAPFIPLEFLDSLLVKKGEEILDASIILFKTRDEESYFSFFSFIEWPLSPRIRKLAEIRVEELKLTKTTCFKTSGEIDIPHPEKKNCRLRAQASVVYIKLSRKAIKRKERNPIYFIKRIPQLVSTLLIVITTSSRHNTSYSSFTTLQTYIY